MFSIDEWCCSSQATRRSDSALDHALGDPSANDNPQGIRKGRMRFSAEQVQSLERRFQEQQYLLPAERKLLAARLGMSERQVKTWFQNKRAQCKRSKSFLRSGLFPVVHFAPAPPFNNFVTGLPQLARNFETPFPHHLQPQSPVLQQGHLMFTGSTPSLIPPQLQQQLQMLQK